MQADQVERAQHTKAVLGWWGGDENPMDPDAMVRAVGVVEPLMVATSS